MPCFYKRRKLPIKISVVSELTSPSPKAVVLSGTKDELRCRRLKRLEGDKDWLR
jgi:hypothetical protein